MRYAGIFKGNFENIFCSTKRRHPPFVPLHTNLDHVYDGLQVFGRFLHPDDPISFVWDNGWEGEFSLLY